jgi:hypothetical protein
MTASSISGVPMTVGEFGGEIEDREIAVASARSSRGTNRLSWHWPEALKPRQCRVDQDAPAAGPIHQR